MRPRCPTNDCNQSNYMRLTNLAGVFNTLVIRGAGSAVTVLFTLLVSRHLDTSAAARFFFLFNISTIAAICFRWGLDEVIIRKMAATPADAAQTMARHLIGVAHRRVLLWTAAGLAGALLLLLPTVRAMVLGLTPAEAAVVTTASAMVALVACASRVHQGLGRTNLAAFLLNILVPMMSLLGLLLLVSQGKLIDAFDLMVLYASVAIVAYAVVVAPRYGVYDARRAGSTLAASSDPNAERRAADLLGGVVVAQQILTWGSFLIVPFAYGDAAYNGFVVAQKTATLVSLIMLAANFTLSPRFAALHASGNQGDLRNITRISAAAIFVSSLAVAVLVILFRDVTFNFARIEMDMTSVLVLLLLSQVFFALAAVFSLVLSMSHDENFLFFAQGGINGAGLIVFFCASRLGGIEVACSAFLGSYMVLALALGLRARAIGAL